MNKIDLSIKTDPKAKGLQYSKMPYGTGNPEAKKQALKDMKDDKDFTRNYIGYDHKIKQLNALPRIVISVANL